MTAGRLFRTANRERGIEADALSRGRCSGSLWRPQRRQVREGVTGCTSVLVAPDHFAARAGRQGGEDWRVQGLLHEADRPIAEQEIAPARVLAPIAARARLGIVGDLDRSIDFNTSRVRAATSAETSPAVIASPAANRLAA